MAKKRNRRRNCSGRSLKTTWRLEQYRLAMCLLGLAGAFTYVGLHLAWAGLVPAQTRQASLLDLPAESPHRGNIYDRNGVLLATSLQSYSVYGDPKMVKDAAAAAQKLHSVLPHTDESVLRARLARNGRFVWLQRHLTPEQAYAVNALGIPGVGFREDGIRVYPHRHLAAHVLGALNYAGKGVAGVERAYDEVLKKGEDITLTLDARLQAQLRATLQETIEKSEAKAATGVVIDPASGDVIAMASLPDFDPNHFGSYQENAWLNRATFGVYEMGSTFKLFTMARALDQSMITAETEIDCTKPIRIGRHTIHDYYAERRVLTAKEVLIHSSNIGAARIADMMGEEKMRPFYAQLNLLDKVEAGISEVAAPLYPHKRWGRVRTMTMAFGHGISVTPLQLVAAVSALVKDGQYRQPHLVKGTARGAPKTVIRPETVGKMREFMRAVVKKGSGRNAQVVGLDIGGKTGTAEKAGTGGYAENKNMASFVGAVPLDNPRMVGLIMVDEGNGGSATGGQVAAPAFARFVERAAPFMGLAKQAPATQIVHTSEGEKLAHATVNTYRQGLER